MPQGTAEPAAVPGLLRVGFDASNKVRVRDVDFADELPQGEAKPAALWGLVPVEERWFMDVSPMYGAPGGFWTPKTRLTINAQPTAGTHLHKTSKQTSIASPGLVDEQVSDCCLSRSETCS